MRTSLLALPVCSALALSGLPAQDVVLNAGMGQATFQQNFETNNQQIYPQGSTPELFLCDPAGDPLGVSFTSKWCFAVRGVDTREFIFNDANNQAVFNNAGNTALVTWADMDGRGLFSATLVMRLELTSPTSGVVIKEMTITNISGAPLPLDMYHFQDIDACGAAYTMNSTTSGPRMTHTTTCGETAEIYAPFANSWETQTSGNLYTRFGDNVRITLADNTGMVGPGDIRAAHGWIDGTIPVGGSRTYILQLAHNDMACGAATTFFGTATPTSAGTPTLQATMQPTLGGVWLIDGTNAPANGMAVLNAGTETDISLARGLNLYATPLITIPGAADPTGAFSFGIQVPNQNALCGLGFIGQAILLDPAAPNGLGAGATQGFEVLVGAY